MTLKDPYINSQSSDEELLIAFKKSAGQAALGILYKRYYALVYGVCLKYFKEPETAKDAVMDIYEELVVKVRKHDINNFKSWLYRVAMNHCLMKLRSKKSGRVIEIDESFMQTDTFSHQEDIDEKEMKLNELEKCLEELPSLQKQSIFLFYTEKKCYNEIAEKTGLEWNKVRSTIQNGRRNLKICMEQNG